MIEAWCAWLYETPLSAYIRESIWVYPMLHWAHILANTLMFGTIVFVDLRLIGAGFTRRRVTDMAQQLLPWTWLGFVLMFLSGAFIFLSDPTRYYAATLFRAKLALMIFAGINALVFHTTVYRGVRDWDERGAPVGARVAGALSLISWIAVMVTGRAVGYFE